MEEKKIDKDQLMSDLAAYLSEEYMECVAEKEKFIEEKYKLEEEKERLIRCVMLEKEKRQIRSVFSPLSLDENLMEEVKEPDTRVWNMHWMCYPKIYGRYKKSVID